MGLNWNLTHDIFSFFRGQLDAILKCLQTSGTVFFVDFLGPVEQNALDSVFLYSVHNARKKIKNKRHYKTLQTHYLHMFSFAGKKCAHTVPYNEIEHLY